MKTTIIAILLWLISSSYALAVTDLNTANQSDLESLPGIGPTKAEAIINFRKQHGGFESIDDFSKGRWHWP